MININMFYAAIGVITFLIIIIAILMVKVLSLKKQLSKQSNVAVGENGMLMNKSQGVVFCRKCGSQYEANLNACPYCKARK